MLYPNQKSNMLKLLKYIYMVWLFAFSGIFFANAILVMPPSSAVEPAKIFNKDINKIVDKTIWSSANPIRDGAKTIADNLKLGDTTAKIDSFTTALDKVMIVAQKVMNYVLSFLALIAIIYLIYYGYILLFNSSDDASTKKAYGAVTNAAWAIIGIWVSRLIISAAFAVVARISV